MNDPSEREREREREGERGGGWRAALPREELDALLEMNDLRSWVSVGIDWALIAAAMGAVVWLPGVLSVVVALAVIGTRQLGLAVLMHEASHRTLFRNRRLNDAVGNWLCAYPVWSDLHSYRAYHLRHHARTWTEDDPDLELARPFPITRASFGRKVRRDLSGRTGLKFARARFGSARARWRAGQPDGRRAVIGFVTTQAIGLGLLTAIGHPWLYALWVGAWFTTHTLVTRIRAIAEHSMPSDPSDPLQHTRTTLASWWERLLIAPNRVNFHLEHHLIMTVPHYNLRRFHRLLRERGALEGANVVRGYRRVLAAATSRAAS
ncbi:MAG: fatty acid desaturase family protein [Myxococcota bacterium]